MSADAKGTPTPGPWVISPDDSDRYLPIRILGSHEHGPIIAGLNDVPPDGKIIGCGGDPEANARLIAAAPDLLEACRRALELKSEYADSFLHAAIKKATGDDS